MVSVLQSSQLSIHDVEAQFGLHRVTDPEFFIEFQVKPEILSDYQKTVLDKAQSSFKHLMTYPMHEEMVKMVVLSPLMSVAGLYEKPFRPTAEEAIEIKVGPEETVVRGRADIWVLRDEVWMTVIEAKGPHLSWSVGVPQTLTYMLSDKQPRSKRFGMITNGSDFIFVKLEKDSKKYGLGEPFSLFSQGNALYDVVSILKSISSL